jgi:hypothetical protein
MRRIELVRASQERLIDAADTFAKGRADRLRLAFRLAGLTPQSYMPHEGGLGGPLIEAKDPRALAAVLDVDEGFAGRIQRAAADMSEAHALELAAKELPLAKPTARPTHPASSSTPTAKAARDTSRSRLSGC